MANLTLRYLDELSYVLNSRKHLANQAKASSVGDLLNAEEERFTPVCYATCTSLTENFDIDTEFFRLANASSTYSLL
ncbi:unnamed protein product [Leptosia nina]|uniref:Uncharacterized protein n=1 Tax=Leptosia nina TaxID=320188 RepID=A0AAV1IX62_9NEOP